jgi:hypothetical protein
MVQTMPDIDKTISTMLFNGAPLPSSIRNAINIAIAERDQNLIRRFATAVADHMNAQDSAMIGRPPHDSAMITQSSRNDNE